MKRFFSILSLSLLLLCSCSDHHTTQQVVTGQVVEVVYDASTESTQCVVRNEDGKAISVIADENTYVYSMIETLDVDTFLSGSISDVMVRIEYDQEVANSTQSAFHATELCINAIWHRDASHLADGTMLDLLVDSSSITYCLKNDVKLLRVDNTIGPAHVYVGGAASFDDLTDEAQAAVLAHYDAQGVLYDIDTTLEAAYSDYLEKTIFSFYRLSQDIVPCASNENIIYFITSVYLPDSSISGQELRIGAAFDRETGAYIPTQELFSCSEEIVIEQLLYLAQITDPELCAEMAAAFDPKYILFFPDYLLITFPAGTLPSQEHSYAFGVDYDAIGLPFILNQWAIPNASE